MVKLIGLLLIASSILALLAGAYIDSNYTSASQVTGNAIANILIQPAVSMNIYDYLAGLVFSYSIVSFIAGILFLFRV